MITEDYVSLETAKLLKEKGFDEEVQRSFFENDGIYAPCDPSEVKRKDVLRIPTLQMALKWLRDVHNLFITIAPHHPVKREIIWMFVIESFNDKLYGDEVLRKYDCYEEACEAAIKYCLENLI